jgi:hypothetical protein
MPPALDGAWPSRITLQAEPIVIELRRHYNALRPNASLDYQAPSLEMFVPAGNAPFADHNPAGSA